MPPAAQSVSPRSAGDEVVGRLVEAGTAGDQAAETDLARLAVVKFDHPVGGKPAARQTMAAGARMAISGSRASPAR